MFVDEGYDQTNPAHVAIVKQIEFDRRDSELKDIKILLQTNAGRRFYWRYLCLCGNFRSSFTGNNTTFFNEGKREIGLYLINDMNEVYPEAFALMQKEEAEKQAMEKNKFLKESKDVR